MDEKTLFKQIAELHQRMDAYERRTPESVNMLMTPDAMEYTDHPASPLAFPWGEKYAFGIKKSGTALTVYPGAIDFCDAGTANTTSETNVTLSGQPAWVYAKITKGGGSATIEGPVASRPTSTSDEYRLPLYEFETDDGGSTYTLSYCALTEARFARPMTG